MPIIPCVQSLKYATTLYLLINKQLYIPEFEVQKTTRSNDLNVKSTF